MKFEGLPRIAMVKLYPFIPLSLYRFIPLSVYPFIPLSVYPVIVPVVTRSNPARSLCVATSVNPAAAKISLTAAPWS